ncbi:hypothetical protein [Streptomyces lavendulocolor]|uniref:hypothetical protein n=1 Tax=Streptomyces lavendulocolor TaxID=67316 RepID=UPI003C2C435E
MTDTATTAEATVPEQAAPPEEKTCPEALGANRLADMLAEITGEPVRALDVEVLVEREVLAEVDRYKGWPLYSTKAAREIDVELLRTIIAERVEWFTGATSPAWDARAASPPGARTAT